MALSSSVSSGPDDSLCGVCLRQHRDPRLLLCLHSFCRECIEQLSVTGENGTVNCPLCRAVCKMPDGGAAGLPKDYTVINLGASNSCDPCTDNHLSKAAKYRCEDCQVLLCDEHALGHLRTSAQEDHAIKLLAEPVAKSSGTSRKGKGSSIQPAVPLCRKHGQALRLHCGACNMPICGDCAAVGKHRRHEPIQYVKDIIEQRKAKVAKQVDELKSGTIARLERSLQAVDRVCNELENRARDVSADIQQAGKRTVSAVEEQVRRLLQEVDDTKVGRVKILHNQRDELKRHLEAAQNAVQFSKRLMEQSAGGEAFLCLLHSLETRTAGLISTEFSERPRHNSRLVFQQADEVILANKAKESIGSIIPWQASAQRSVVEGQHSTLVCRGNEVKFVLQAVTADGNVLEEGGDTILPRWVDGPSQPEHRPPLSVEDHDDGKYTISCTPMEGGIYHIEVFVNDERMPNALFITCLKQRTLEWDDDECHPLININSSGLKASTALRSGSGFMSVLGNRVMRAGKHTWKVKIGERADCHMLGVSLKPLSAKRKNDHLLTAYCWYSHGEPYSHDAKWDNVLLTWLANDVFQLCLNCDRHTLQLRNLRSGESSTIFNLPSEKEYFQFASMFHRGNSVEFIKD